MNIPNQIIVNKDGNSWLGFWTGSKKFQDSLSTILEISERYKKEDDSFEYRNAFWVLDFDGTCRAAQASLNGALKHYDPSKSTLVHYQKTFV